MQIIQFFPRQPIAGGAVTLYSEVYDVADYAQIVAQLKIDAYSGTNPISAILQDCMDPVLAPDTAWRNVASNSLASIGSAMLSGSGLLRFARMQLTVSSTVTGTILSVDAVAKEMT